MADAGKRRPGAPTMGARFARPVNQQVLVFAFLGILVLTLLGPFMTFNNPATSGTGSPLRQGLYVFAFAATVVGLRPWAEPARLLALPLPIALALGWCFVTLAWAIEPNIASRRLILTAIITWSIFAAVPRMGYDRSLILVRVLLAAAVVANYLAVFGWPAFGIHQADEAYDKALVGDWRGVMLHKNIAGAVCAMAVIAFAFDRRRMPKALQWGVIAISAFFLWRSGSRTSMGVCVAALLVGFLFLRYQARHRGIVLGMAVVGALVIGIFLNIYNDPLLQHTQDQSAFTGRTQIWAALSGYIADHPLGTGYGSFWNIGPDSPVFEYATGWVTEVAEGHNGFLDLAATIGIPGLIIVLAGVVVWPLFRLFASPAANGPRGALILGIIVFCVAHNATESSLLDRDTVVNVFLMVALALLWAVTARGQGPVRERESAIPGVRRRETPRDGLPRV